MICVHFLLAIIAASVYLFPVPQAFNVTNRIVGGTKADIKNYPYQVSIAFNGEHACGGSILTAKYILSAAHCFAGSEAKVKTITVRAGSSFRTTGGQVVTVKSVTSHSSFNLDTYDYDVAVVRLATALKFGTGVAAIKLASATDVLKDGQLAIATGWGFTADNGDLSYQLQMVSLPVIVTKSCQIYYGTSAVTNRMVCAGYAAGGKDTCTGDSGGPLVLGSVQIGIVSWGDICAGKNAPGVYTKVSEFITFINKIVNAG